MKKLMILCLIGLVMSCNKVDVPPQPKPKYDCDCGTIVGAGYIWVDTIPINGRYIAPIHWIYVKNNCTGNLKFITLTEIGYHRALGDNSFCPENGWDYNEKNHSVLRLPKQVIYE